jgi:uncharacterized cupredoxin-like copper-binding protein
MALCGCGEDEEGRVDISGGATDTSTSGTSTEESSVTGTAVATVSVAETEYRLSPANPSVAKAGVVEFEVVNAGKVAHALEVEGPGGEVETDEIKPGSSATLKADLDKAGRYEWYCPIGNHKDRGMKGEITVAGGSEAGSDGHDGY